MTEEADIAGLYQQFDEILRVRLNVIDLLNERKINHREAWVEAKTLVEEYTDARILFGRIKGDSTITMRHIGLSKRPANKNLIMEKIREVLVYLRIECKKAMAVLEKLSHPSISPKGISELQSLRGELEKISSKIDVNIEKNMEMAIGEYEAGHYLPSALLSSRVIVSQLDKVKGKGDEEKINELKKSGKIKSGRKDTAAQLIKASKVSRNFFSHDPNIFATPDEALSLLSDCIRIVKLVDE